MRWLGGLHRKLRHRCIARLHLLLRYRRLCHRHSYKLRRLEQLGNLIILGSVSFGVHEIEAAASAGVAAVMVVLILANEDA